MAARAGVEPTTDNQWMATEGWVFPRWAAQWPVVVVVVAVIVAEAVVVVVVVGQHN